jgi:hypothetical protein
MELKDRDGSNESFRLAVEEAKKIDSATSNLKREDILSGKGKLVDGGGMSGAILSRFSDGTLLLMGALGGLVGILLNAIIKQFVGDTAKVIRSEERIRTAFVWLGTRWRKKPTTVHGGALLNPNGLAQTSPVAGDASSP